MRKHFFNFTWILMCMPVSLFAQTAATPYTAKANQTVQETLNFANRQDFEDARRGFIVTSDTPNIFMANGKTSYPLKDWEFLQNDSPATANPSLWRQSQLNSIHGLFEVIPGKVYQIRGFDLANMSFVRTDSGWIDIDVLTVEESAKAGYDLIKKHVGNFPIRAVILTHHHSDHYGGLQAIRQGAPNKDFEIIAPKGFLKAAQNENIMAGPAMARRATYMYGLQLTPDAQGFIGTGLGQTLAKGKKTLPHPTDEISQTGETRTIDGLQMEFVSAPESEAPVEIMIYFPQLKAFCTAEDMTHTMHNLLTLRGAKVRNGLLWSKYIDQVITRYGAHTDVVFSSHHWPMWGNKRILPYLEAQRDLYRYLHDQTLHLANQGYTPEEIAEAVKLPTSLDSLFHCRGYYGTVSHNVKSQYQMYFGWFDGNPAHLNPLPPTELGKKYVEALGGAAHVMEIAEKGYRAGEYRWVATLLDHLVFAEPENRAARKLLADTYMQLGYQAESGPWRNFYLTGSKDLTRNEKPYTPVLTNYQTISQMDTETLFDFCAIQINKNKAEGKEVVLNLHFNDTGEDASLILKNSVLNHRLNRHEEDAPLDLTLSKKDFVSLFFGTTNLKELCQDQKASANGCKEIIDILTSCVETAHPNFNIVIP